MHAIYKGMFVLSWLVGLGCFGCEWIKIQPPTESDWALESVYVRGTVALLEGKADIAQDAFRAVLAKDANHLRALTKLAQTLVLRAKTEPSKRQESLAEAIGLLRQALEVDANNKICLVELGKIALSVGQLSTASEAFGKANQLDPSDLNVVVYLAKSLEQNKMVDRAEQLLRKHVAADPNRIRLELGRTYLRRDKPAQAQKVLQRIVACPESKFPPGSKATCPSSVFYLAQNELGEMAIRQSNFSRAGAIYTNMVRLFPGDTLAWEILAALDEKKGDFSAAEDKYRRSLAMDQVHMTGWRGLGRSLAAQKKTEKAKEAYRKADHYLGQQPLQALSMADELVSLGEINWAQSLVTRAMILIEPDKKQKTAFEAKLAELNQLQKNLRGTNPSDENKN